MVFHPDILDISSFNVFLNSIIQFNSIKRSDGSIARTLKDGHNEVVDKKGNVEVDDLDDDQKSFCEEIDVKNADGTIDHVKKWHHHTADHFGVYYDRYIR